MSEKNKVQYRKIALDKRKRLHGDIPHNEYGTSISHFFHKWILREKAISVIGLYYPVNSEMNPLTLIDYLETQGKITCLPIVVDKNSPLIFKAWSPGQDMVAGDYGIPVPDNDQIVTPDLVICPLLAYDAKGMRLGYGGGFYDRTILNFKQNIEKKIFTVGLAFSCQKYSGKLPIEKNDEKIDCVLTEKGFQFFDI